MDRQLITPQLMREHGWDIKEVGDNGPATPKEHRNRYEKWVSSERWNLPDSLQRPIFYDRHTGEWFRNGKEIVYIDQL